MIETVMRERCPRCGGNVFLERDFYGEWYEDCLQCGYLRYLETVVDTSEATVPMKK